jgi:hypothetical protein
VPLIYVTGVSGARKSAVCDALRVRGYEAYDADRDGFKSWYDRVTDARATDQRRWSRQRWNGTARTGSNSIRRRPRCWRDEHAPCPTRSSLCGTSAGEDVVWHLFDKVVQLPIGEQTLRRRIETRTDNDFGKPPGMCRGAARSRRYVGAASVLPGTGGRSGSSTSSGQVKTTNIILP